VFGGKLREIRVSRGMKATAVIARLGVLGWPVSSSTYSQIEGGRRILADTELMLILRVLNAGLSDLE
jgi:transcriptional regulator with XRE-family HTH domain